MKIPKAQFAYYKHRFEYLEYYVTDHRDLNCVQLDVGLQRVNIIPSIFIKIISNNATELCLYIHCEWYRFDFHRKRCYQKYNNYCICIY